MGLPKLKQHYITEQEYLDDEKRRDIKHEYFDGEIFAMAGASSNHQRLISRLVQKISNHLEDTPCEVFSSDMKVRADEGNKYFYPDVVVACEKQNDEPYFINSPRIIIEVLSNSTRKFDKDLKRKIYQTIPTFEEYVLIEQDHVEIEVCRKSENWQSNYYFIDDEVTFASIDLTLPVLDIYKRVDNEEMREFLHAETQKTSGDESFD
ncbi:MAG: Uma2 family endonuclease [Methylococcales bacterium]|nr:Uma2 family endonuclease [Methylococcales bacterium]